MSDTATISLDEDQLDSIVTAISRISHGPTFGPGAQAMGLESIAMCLTGAPGRAPLSEVLENANMTLERLADAADRIADALEKIAPAAICMAQEANIRGQVDCAEAETAAKTSCQAAAQ